MKKGFSNMTFRASSLPSVKAIGNGLLYIMPMVLIGSFVTAFLNLPIPAFQNAMNGLFHDSWQQIAQGIYEGTSTIMGLAALITISYCYAGEKKQVAKGEVNVIFVVMTTVAVFFTYAIDSSGDISLLSLGANGMFHSIILSILVPNVYLLFYQLYQKMHKQRAYDYNGNPIVQSAFYNTFPVLLTVLVFVLAQYLLALPGTDFNIAGIFARIIAYLAVRPGLISNLLIVFLTQLMWFFGIHGGNVLMDALARENVLAAVEMGAGAMISKDFLDTFVFMGGVGATLGLVIAMLIFGEKNSGKRLAKSSIVPGILNINEPMVYGIPIVLNPYFMIPFLAMPLLLTLVSSFAVQIGFIPSVFADVEWTTPIFLSGYYATGTLRGSILQGFNLLISFGAYAPFVILHKKRQHKQNLLQFEHLTKELQYIKMRQQHQVISMNNELGALARQIAAELELGLMDKNEMLYMVYQPKMNDQGQVIGAEALLRCKHPVLGPVSPMTVVSICDEAGMTQKLGRWVFSQSVKDCRDFLEKLGQPEGFVLSINLNPKHLAEDEQLIPYFQSTLEEYGVEEKHIELELTENSMVSSDNATLEKLQKIHELGMSISIDDFGMGHSSLSYISNYYASVVKLDISLIRLVDTDSGSREIVKSILNLCRELHVMAIAEGVETESQLVTLKELSCPAFQGYYFCRPVPKEEFLQFVEKHTVI